jgi:cellulose synthase/poly-beta-1,6-N-acetylglucosamine synthase-like glycosyltransferase
MGQLPEELEIPIGRRTLKYRFFEILPGTLSWFMLLLPIGLSIIDRTSRLAAVFILFFMMGWFYRAVGMAFRTLQGYQKMKQSAKIPWQKWLTHLENPQKSIDVLLRNKNMTKEDKIHLANLKAYGEDEDLHDIKPSDIVQFMIVPMWRESYEVVAPTIQSLLSSNYDSKQVVLVIAYEKRGGEVPKATAEQLIKEFGSKFMYAETIEHPDDLPNEVIGKGGNVTWAARKMVPYFEKQNITPNRVIVTTLDADNRVHPDYFAHLTYSYILTNDRKHHSYQPLALYTNNIWDVPAPMRVLAVGNSFFTITQSVRPHLLRNFSSHAQSLDALIETDFWSTRTIVEDGHQFWRSYFAFKGNHQVVPLYSPTYQDAVLSDTYKATIKDQFTQVRRWAYGASDIPYIANLGFRSKKDRIVPLSNFIPKFFRLLDTHVSWATVSLLLLLSARIPLLIGPSANKSIVAHQLPVIASYAQTLAMIGLFMSIFLSMKLLPPRPARYKRSRTVFMLLQWILLPITSIAYGSLAALNSQTRLMIGKYLNKFDLTHKGRKS